MQGFFSKEQVQSSSRGKGGRALSCARCGLYKDCRNPRMGLEGNGRKGILLIGDGSTSLDDRRGYYWNDKNSKLLVELLEDEFNINIYEDCYSIMATGCTSEDANEDHVECCRPRVWKAIDKCKPKLIILFGTPAIRSFYGGRTEQSLGIAQWRGFLIPDRKTKAWVCPIISPNKLNWKKNKLDPANFIIWKKDLRKALTNLDQEVPTFIDEKEQVEIVPRGRLLRALLRDLLKVKRFAFDYEATGLKPHREGHQIICTSISPSPDKSYAFMQPEEGPELSAFQKLLAKKEVGKIAHNLKMEHAWSFVRAGVEVQNWEWDTMQAAHVIDNRRYITGLKFQSLINFGLLDYNSHIDEYLVGVDPKDKNSFNRLLKYMKTKKGKEEALIYCGIDGLNTHRLALKQMGILL